MTKEFNPTESTPGTSPIETLIEQYGDEISEVYDHRFAVAGDHSAVIDEALMLDHEDVLKLYLDMSRKMARIASAQYDDPEVISQLPSVTYNAMVFSFQTCIKFSDDESLHHPGAWREFIAKLDVMDPDVALEAVMRCAFTYLKDRPALTRFIGNHGIDIADGSENLISIGAAIAGIACMLIEEEHIALEQMRETENELKMLLGDNDEPLE